MLINGYKLLVIYIVDPRDRPNEIFNFKTILMTFQNHFDCMGLLTFIEENFSNCNIVLINGYKLLVIFIVDPRDRPFEMFHFKTILRTFQNHFEYMGLLTFVEENFSNCSIVLINGYKLLVIHIVDPQDRPYKMFHFKTILRTFQNHFDCMGLLTFVEEHF